MSSSDTVPTPLQVLQKVQTETGQAFLVTDGNTQRIIEKHQANLEKPAPKKKVCKLEEGRILIVFQKGGQ